MKALLRKLTAVICSAALMLTAAVTLPENAVTGGLDINSAADDTITLPTGSRRIPEPIELSAEELDSISEGVKADYENAETISDSTVSPCTGYDHSCSYYYDQLNTKQKALWDGICAAFDKLLTSTVDLTQSYTFNNGFKIYYCSDKIQYDSSISDNQVAALFELLVMTNPQYYFVYNYSWGSVGSSKYLTPNVIGDCAKYSNRKAYQNAITSKTNEWIPKINAKTTVLQKELYISELISDYIEYDDASLNDNPGDWHDQSIIGVFYDRSAVCAGYAHAVTYLCNAVGIPCVDMVYEGCHEWNRVCLYGTWYETDVTWYDTAGKDKSWLNRSHSKILQMDDQNAHKFTTEWYTTLGVSYPPADVDTVYSVKSISISKNPTKTSYAIGEALDLRGGKVTASLSSGGTYTFDMTASMVSGFSSSTAGTKTLTVTFDGKTATFPVTVGGSSTTTAKSIKISAFPKTSYKVGESLDVSGGMLTVTYNDNSVETIAMTTSMVSGFSSATTGTKTLTVTYQNCKTTYTITVSNSSSVTAKSIKISAFPKTSYKVGESLDVSGGMLTVTYNDDSTGTIAMTTSMVSGFSSATTGTKTLTVTYQNCKTTYTITVSNSSSDDVQWIMISSYPKTDYKVGESLDVSGGSIMVCYSDSSIETVAMTKSMISGFSTAAAGICTVTVTYKGCTTSYYISVSGSSGSSIVSIMISQYPRTSYKVGESLDVSGGSIYAIYDDGSFRTVAMTASMISGFTTRYAGTYTVTVTYMGCTTTYAIFVTEDGGNVQEITIISYPKTEYLIDEPLDLTGGMISVRYADGSIETLSMTKSMISEFSTEEAGIFTVRVTYGGCSTIYLITVEDDYYEEVISISLVKTPKTEYNVGDELDVTGGRIKVRYEDYYSEVIEITPGMISGFTTAKAGKYTVTITYGGCTCTYQITVNGAAISNLAISRLPKTGYFVGDELDVSGGELSVTYSDGTVKYVDITEDMISGFTTAKAGTFTITVTYEGLTVKYGITVSEGVVTGIAIKTAPKTQYYVDDLLDITGGVITVTYSSGKTSDIAMTPDMIIGFTTEIPAAYSVTVKYAGFTASYNVTVIEDAETGITIATAPKSNYYIDEELDLTGAAITVAHLSGKEVTVPITDDMVSGFDSSAEGTFTVTVTYKSFTATFSVTVSERPYITGISIEKYPKTMYFINDRLDVKGGTIRVTYSDGNAETVSITEDMVSGFSSAETGKLYLTVTYEGFTAEYEITVSSVPLIVNGKAESDLAKALAALKNTTGRVEIVINKSLAVPDKVTFPAKASLISIKGASRSVRLDLMKVASITFSCPVEIDSITIKNSKNAAMPITAKSSITLNNAEIGALKVLDDATVTNSNIMGAFTGSSKYGTMTIDTTVIAGNFNCTSKTATTDLSDVTVTGNLTVTGSVDITGTVSINGIFTPKGSMSLSGELQAGRWE